MPSLHDEPSLVAENSFHVAGNRHGTRSRIQDMREEGAYAADDVGRIRFSLPRSVAAPGGSWGACPTNRTLREPMASQVPLLSPETRRTVH